MCGGRAGAELTACTGPGPRTCWAVLRAPSAFPAVCGGNKSPSRDQHGPFVPACPWRWEMCLERGGLVFCYLELEGQ